MSDRKKNLICWAVSDGRAGIEVQCTGLAEAMGFDPIIHQVQMRQPWRGLPPKIIPLHTSIYKYTFPPKGGWPDIVIACGRQAALFNALVRQQSGGKSYCIQVQDPKVSPVLYDLIITPEHDILRGENVLTTLGGINKVTPEKLKTGAINLRPRIEDLPRPLVAVLIGGKSKAYDLTEDIIRQLGKDLQKLHRETNCGFLVTTSRRTGKENEALLHQYLSDLPAFIWDGTGENPYFGFLGSADAIIVTSDSVNMVTEAASTGSPVFTVDLKGGNKKFDRFHHQLKAKGITRPFTGSIENWDYAPLDETKRIAQIVLNKLRELGRL